ncbi:MAG: GTPase HflX [Firmicutes bacterium]|nr:GTPase HflX [Bacillota bacterium]
MRVKQPGPSSRAGQPRRAILVGSDAETLPELAELARSAGVLPLEILPLRSGAVDPATLVTRGKLEELHSLCHRLTPDLILVDDELSPAVQRNLEDYLDVRVLDRTQLILDIFAQRAHTREGALQVELAQLTYLLPRLAGRGGALSRLGGGIGTRGPGETRLETDRRRVRRRIAWLRTQLAQVEGRRQQVRDRRRQHELALVALVGYTNAGKTSLLNALTQAGAAAEDRLFATLDPLTRRLVLPGCGSVLVTDTVGFIRKLPHQLVAAFRATLEEAVDADVLIHVIDIHAPDCLAQKAVVEQVLQELGAGGKPLIEAYNKVDLLPSPALPWMRSGLSSASTDEARRPSGDPEGGLGPVRPWGRVMVSARTGFGLDSLKQLLAAYVARHEQEATFLFPYDRLGELRRLHDDGRVISTRYTPAGVAVRAMISPHLAARLSAWRHNS